MHDLDAAICDFGDTALLIAQLDLYPSMRLFWQTRPGDWAEIMSRVAAALSER